MRVRRTATISPKSVHAVKAYSRVGNNKGEGRKFVHTLGVAASVWTATEGREDRVAGAQATYAREGAVEEEP